MTKESFSEIHVAEIASECIRYALRRCEGSIPAFTEVFYGGGNGFQVRAATGEWFLISVERGPK